MVDAISQDVHIIPSKVQSNVILEAIRKRKSWDDVETAVRQVANEKKISNIKIKEKKAMYPKGEKFEALKLLKEYTDTRDDLLLYEINDSKQYIFKTSQNKMEQAKHMNISTEHHMNK